MRRGGEVVPGFTEDERDTVGALYWGAFGSKLGRAFAREEDGLACITASMHPARTLVARRAGAVAGICGFYDGADGALDVTWRTLRAHLPVTGALRALAVLGPLAQTKQAGVLVLDGICVAESWRGHGIGTTLLHAAIDLAASRGLGVVQLSVIETNPRARALYERVGFVGTTTQSLGFLARLYGFDRYTTMRYRVGQR